MCDTIVEEVFLLHMHSVNTCYFLLQLFPRSSFLVPGNWLSMLPFPVTITHTGHKAGMPQNDFLFYEMAFLMCYQSIKQIKETLAPRREMLNMQGLNVYRKVVAILMTWPNKGHHNTHRHLHSLWHSKRDKESHKNTGKEEERFCKEKSCIQIYFISLHPMNKKRVTLHSNYL